MNKFFLNVVAGVLALFAMSTSAQAQVSVNGTMPVVDQQVVFGSQNVSHGFIRVTTSSEKFYLSELVLRVRECSNWNIARLPYLNFSISTNTTIYPGTVGYSSADGEPIVTFGIGEIQAPNTTRTYAILSDVVGYSSFVEADKQCLRLVLDPAGVVSKSPVTGTFPVRLSAKTFVRSKPTVTITAIGATTNRVRTVSDDVFLLSISADTTHEILIKEIAPYISGSAPIGGYFQVVDHNTGNIIAIGDLSGQANISFQWPGMFGEYYVNPGASRSFRIRVNSSVFPNNAGSESFSLQLSNPCDFQWDTQGGNAGGPGLCLEPQVVPITATVSYE